VCFKRRYLFVSVIIKTVEKTKSLIDTDYNSYILYINKIIYLLKLFIRNYISNKYHRFVTGDILYAFGAKNFFADFFALANRIFPEKALWPKLPPNGRGAAAREVAGRGFAAKQGGVIRFGDLFLKAPK